MKYFGYLLLSLCLIACGGAVFAQNNDDAHALVKDGIQLNNEKKYAEAIDKYTQALKIDSGYLFADYQMALSLSAINKRVDGLPYLQKIINANTSLKAAAYDLSGLIYFGNKQYAEAEKDAIEAIKLDPKHASTQRMYALVCFHQNKRAAALLGFCSFILLEPNTQRSTEAYGNIQHILQGGTLKPEPGEKAPIINTNDAALNQAITRAVAEAAKEKYASPVDQLAAQLKNIFTVVGALTEKQGGDGFFSKYLAGYFYQMAQSSNMPAFARFINGTNPESAKWIKDNPQQMADLDSWVKANARDF